MNKRILILYTAVGLGHKVIAENIASHLQQDGYAIELYDSLKLQAGAAVTGWVSGLHFFYKRTPFIWKWLYLWAFWPALPFRVFAARFHSENIKTVIDAFKPDLVISTATAPSAAVASLKQRGLYNGLFAISFSDFHFHRFWMYPRADMYLTNIPEQKQELMKRGISEIKIAVCGMVTLPKPAVNVNSVRTKFAIPPLAKVVLVSSGSQGTGLHNHEILELHQELQQQAQANNLQIHLIVICGKNQNLRDRLESLVDASQVTVLGYYTPMAELYAIADMYLTKPGGISTIESLQWNVPIIATHYLPGQEELNYKYLMERKLLIPGLMTSMKLPDLVARIIQELKTGEHRQSLINNVHRLGLVQESESGKTLQSAIYALFHGKSPQA